MNKLQSFKSVLASIPAVHEIQNLPKVQKLISQHGHSLVTSAIRSVQSDFRDLLTASGENNLGKINNDKFIKQLKNKVLILTENTLKPIFNLTGTVLHTNFGRALLPDKAIKSIELIASDASNLEYDITSGERGDRDNHIDEKLCRLTGAEAATIVNNNAAAVTLVLNSLARRKEVLVSRGELIEIGGSFRLPDIMSSSGCKLHEVGTTNRTYLQDFEEALGPRTALILKAHTSNYKLQGFTSDVKEKDFANFSKKNNIPFVVDLGSGSIIDLSYLGLPKCQTPAETIKNGADLVTFSGDKLLGGPQCGIIVGRKDLISRIKKNPLKRALRCDKMTIAAFSELLKLYENPKKAKTEIPTLRLISRRKDEIQKLAKRMHPTIKSSLSGIATVQIIACKSQVGSGSFPVEFLPSFGFKIEQKLKNRSSSQFLNSISSAFRALPVPIVGRINKNAFLLDLRCLENETLFAKQFQYLNLKELES